ncbi:haloacid dehalogenase type II [Gillisia sp. M10.2A]|uniref:Haloacid dehalogenase type II n=1 Tax=Gillisia lutea TaxID=2909668 RepID=A0ABS9ED51_9FLAO|nr:haloacid dehalogenase type II [Gillisia lutea]MCF4100793.1 haloacid dehalogenase type II [Gillisia lutea]
MLPKPKLLIFDVNETLLDLFPLKQAVNKLLEDPGAFDLWFSGLLHYSLVETITGNYRDFGEIGKATLRKMGLKYNKQVSDADCEHVLEKITRLPAHIDVVEGLQILRQCEYKLVAFSNGGLKTLKEQLKFAEIHYLFDEVLSVESIQKFKPHPETYQYVLTKFHCKPEEAMLIAAHDWDVAGAMRAGLQAGFVSRPGKFLSPTEMEPRLEGKTIKRIAKDLLML